MAEDAKARWTFQWKELYDEVKASNIAASKAAADLSEISKVIPAEK
jgi:hypothetical protein